MYRNLLLPLALLVMSGAAVASTPIEQSYPLSAKGTVDISNVAGKVTVTGWDRNEVSIAGSLGEGAKPLKVEHSKGRISIKVEAERSSGWFNWGGDSNMKPTTLIIQVPRGVQLDVDVVSANTEIEDVANGKISVDSVSGQVHVDAHSPEVSVDTVSGDVELMGAVDKLDIDTVSGDIRAPMVRREAKLESVSGDIYVKGGPFDSMEASTVSGDLELHGGPSASGCMHVETMSGDVVVQLPAEVSARIEASSFSGDIKSNLGEIIQRSHGPGSNLRASAGAGTGSISLETFSGDISIQRATGSGQGD